MALWDKDLSPLCLPQIPSCNSSKISSDASGWLHSGYGPEKEHLYSFWFSDSQKWGAFLRTLSAYDLSSGKMSSFKNSTMGSIQLGPTLTCWTWTTFPLTFVGLHKSSIRITRGKLCVEEVASVARESAYVFPLLGTCSRLNDSNLDCKCLTFLSTLAFSHPLLLICPSLGRWPVSSLRTFSLSFPQFSKPWTFLPVKFHIWPHYL